MSSEYSNARRMAQAAWMTLWLWVFYGFGQDVEFIEIGAGTTKLQIPKIHFDIGVLIFSAY